MRRLKADSGCASFVVGLQETSGAEAPAIARIQTGKVEFGAWGAEVVPDIFGKGEELGCHNCTDRVAALIGGASVAMPVTEKAGDRIHPADHQVGAEYVDAVLWVHCVQSFVAATISRNMSMLS